MELSLPVSKLPKVGPYYTRRLENLGIFSLENLINYVPTRYKDLRNISKISDIKEGDLVTIQGEVISIKNIYTRYRKKLQLAQINDGSGIIQAVWFNQTYIVKNITVGQRYSFSGKVGLFNRKASLTSPDYENIEGGVETLHTARLVPVYSETAGVSSKWLRAKIYQTISLLESSIKEFLPDQVRKDYNFPGLKNAIKEVHFPKTISEGENARKRLAFDELLLLHLKSLQRKKAWFKNILSKKIVVDQKTKKTFIDLLPFKLTASQLQAIDEIYTDLKRVVPMNRLLQGDVGSGKTVVAAAAAFGAFLNGFQTVIMAPTQILAAQHFASLGQVFKNLKLRISLITSSGVTSDLGKTDIFVGTHALIHKKVKFDNVALVVIDEQHRFGVEQRAHLVRKSKKGRLVPNVLTMTATPIPRTIALTLYGDLDLSVLTDLPLGRQKITTWLIPQKKREGAYSWIKDQIKKSRVQAYFVCPLIEESSVETMKSAKAATQMLEELKEYFRDLNLGLLHGRQKVSEKNQVLQNFRMGKIDLLVATPVVEVGIDVPNATIMVIEGAERYGLSQLHQLRGRVGRGEKKSYCLIFTSGGGKKSTQRLEALTKPLSGFELSELDLSMRGPGEVFGVRQHGIPELKIATWTDSDLIKQANQLAQKVLSDPKKYSSIMKRASLQLIINN